MARDYYEILGIPRASSADEIKKAHRKLARKFHPDMNKNNPSATEKFKEVQTAYDVLSDPVKKQNYDQFGHAGVDTAGAGAPDPFEAFRRSQQNRRGAGAGKGWSPNGATVQDFDAGGAGGNFSDIFEQLFGAKGGAGAGRPRSAQPRQAVPRGADIEHPVTLSFEHAARGTMLPLQIDSGGRIETIEIKIPGGVNDGSRIRVKGRGQPSSSEPGDLYIVTTVQPHPFFRREGLNIYLDLPLSMYEAILGTKVEVPTLDGPVTLTIPPGTGGGAKLRIRGRGVASPSEKGDQFVEVRILVPKSLAAEDVETIEKLSAKYPIAARADLPWSV